MPVPGDLVDVDALDRWVDACLPGRLLAGPGPLRVDSLGDGHSNLTFSVSRGGSSVVLRRPPRGPLLPTAHDVVREYRVLQLLHSAGRPVRAPQPLGVCEDPTVIGAPFYLMGRVDGVVVRGELPAALAGDDAALRRLGLDLADALAQIHLLPWEPFVAARIGRAGGYLSRQLRRWAGQRAGTEQAVAQAGGHARALPDYEAVAAWLVDHLPPEQAPALVHGDYKMDNTVVDVAAAIGADPARPAIVAVIDWEMATVGDPRADLGYLLSFWPEPGQSLPLGDLFRAHPGLPTRAELVQRWSTATGRDPGDTRWFTTLALWKLAVLLEASYHRWLAGTADDPFFATLADGVPALLAHARDTCGA